MKNRMRFNSVECVLFQDENSERRPVCSIVHPIRANRLLNTPREAARFVGLIPVGKSESIGQGMVQFRCTSMHAFLCCNKGVSNFFNLVLDKE